GEKTASQLARTFFIFKPPEREDRATLEANKPVPSEPHRHIDPSQPQLFPGTVVKCRVIPVAIITDFRPDLEQRRDVVGPADGVARVVPREAVSEASLVFGPLVPKHDEVPLRKHEHRVVEYAIVQRKARDKGPEPAAAVELDGADAGR